MDKEFLTVSNQIDDVYCLDKVILMFSNSHRWGWYRIIEHKYLSHDDYAIYGEWLGNNREEAEKTGYVKPLKRAPVV